MDTAVRMPITERINFRMILFTVVMLGLIGYPIYVYLESVYTGGIKYHDNGYVEIDLKAMSTFPLDQQRGTIEDVPKKWREQDGKKVILVGEMWDPLSAGERITNFDLVYSIAKCCFSGPPQIQHFVKCSVPEGKKVGYYRGLVKVIGTLHVDVKTEDGKVTQVYAVDIEDVQPV